MKKEGAKVKNNNIKKIYFFGTGPNWFFLLVVSVTNQINTTIPPIIVIYNNCHQPDLPISCSLRQPADNCGISKARDAIVFKGEYVPELSKKR